MKEEAGAMHRNVKFIAVLLCLLMALTSLSGCFRTAADDLYGLPQASKEYLELQKQINAVLASGAEYSPPISGLNRQSVQLKDIDSDGTNEAIAFFRTTGDKPLRIHIMKQMNNTYETVNVIDGDGTAIDSIRYADMDGDGISELIVGWQMSATLLHMTIYDIRNSEEAVLAETDYSKHFVSDLTGDGRADVIALRLSSSDLPGEAILFSLGENREPLTSTAGLSSGLESVSRIMRGHLNDGTPAVFVEGVIGGTGVVTDIFSWQSGAIVNVLVRPSSGVSEDTLRPQKVYSTDINGDGVVDVPMLRLLDPESDSNYYTIDWYSYDRYGGKRMVLSTYHNFQDGWYMILPNDWRDAVAVRREDNIPGERTVVFSSLTADGETADFLKIYTLSGDNKEDRAGIDSRFELHNKGDVIYAAEILSTDIPITLDKPAIADSFRLVEKEWATGVY